jgi:deazaflavin-dependent oxidoreductase (nitroreductase family)
MTPTRSQNQPPRLFRLLVKAQNPLMKWLLRSPFHFIVSRMYLLITFTGRKSGVLYTTPVQYSQQGEQLAIITSEGYTWWKNLRGGTEVQVHLRGKSYPAHADISTDPPIISALLQNLYPVLSSEQRTRFGVGKVAITVTLPGQQADINGRL